MTSPTPPPGAAGGLDPLVASLDDLVRSGRLTPDSARAALIAAGGGSDNPAGGPASGTHAATPTGGATDARRLRMIVPFDAALTAIGVGFLAVVTVLTTLYARADGQLVPDASALLGGGAGGGDDSLDVPILILGIVAALLLLGIAVAGRLLGGTRAVSSTLVGWSAAFGALATAAVIGVIVDDDGALITYLLAALITALGVAGYVVSRQAAPLFVAILGLLGLYAQAVSDLFDAVGLEGDNHPWLLAACAVAVFVVVVTVVGLRVTPRGFAGAVVGWISVLTHAVVMVGIAVASLVSGVIGGFSGEAPETPPSYDLDVYIVLVVSVVLILLWAVCYLLTENVAYRLLIVLMLLGTLPAATVALSVDSPIVWQVVALVLGVAALGYVVLRTMSSARAARPTTDPAHAAPTGP